MTLPSFPRLVFRMVASCIVLMSVVPLIGRTSLAAVPFAAQATVTGLDFPGSAGVTNTMRFKFANPQNNGLPIYGPSGSGVTYIWRAYPRQQPGYYTAFFWGNDDGRNNLNMFLWKSGGGADSYYGAHPYPQNPPNGSTHSWEISVEQNDFVNGAVQYNRWHTQALRVWADANGKHHEFYWDLPNTDAAHRVTRTSPTSWGNVNPPAPALTWGDAPWAPGNEVWSGILRGIQIYSTKLSLPDVLSEVNSPLSTSAGASKIWYLNTNPTPTDISDKSGKGHHPAWVGSERPKLYSSGVVNPVGVSITSPAPGTVFSPGQSVTATGTGTNLVWGIDRLGDGLPDFAGGTGSGITFTVPVNATSAQTIRIKLSGTGGSVEQDHAVQAAGSGTFTVTVNSVSTGKTYSVGSASVGAMEYIDRSYTIGSLSAGLSGGVLVRTANNDKNVAATTHFKVTPSATATVYVAWDKRIAGLPAWLTNGSWTATGETYVSGGLQNVRVYARSVAGGTVLTLGGNLASPAAAPGTGHSHYAVIVKKQ